MRIKIRETLQGGNGTSNTYICIAAENPGMPVVIWWALSALPG